MARGSALALDDMLDALVGIEQEVAGKSFAEFQRNWLLRHGVQRAIEIISEASRSVDPTTKQSRPEIPWDKVRDIGNVIRHAYHSLSDQLIWNIVLDELPKLKIAVMAMRERP